MTLQKKGENYRGPLHAGGVNNPSGGTNASKSKKVPTETTTDADPEPVSIVGAIFWCLHPQTSKKATPLLPLPSPEENYNEKVQHRGRGSGKMEEIIAKMKEVTDRQTNITIDVRKKFAS